MRRRIVAVVGTLALVAVLGLSILLVTRQP